MAKWDWKKQSHCLYCLHYNAEKSIFSCKAFPNGIPLDIASGQFNHHKAFKGDKGIRFKLDEEKIKREEKIQKLLER